MTSAKDIAPRLAGRFVVIDGPDGAGKTTQVNRLAAALDDAGVRVVTVRDPGGTRIGEQVRKILLDPENAEMDVVTEMLLYQASRAQLVDEMIRPALAAGAVVLSDRFVGSTCAYQGLAGGLPIETVLDVGRVAIRDAWPDVTVVLDLPAEQGLARNGDELPDRMESKGVEFHRRVRELYQTFAAEGPRFADGTPVPGQYVLVDAVGRIEVVEARILEAIASVDF